MKDRRKAIIESLVDPEIAELYRKSFSNSIGGRECVIEKDDYIVTTHGKHYGRVIREICIQAKEIIPGEDNSCRIKFHYDIDKTGFFKGR